MGVSTSGVHCELQLGHPPEGVEASQIKGHEAANALLQLGHPPGGDGSGADVAQQHVPELASIGPPPGGDGSTDGRGETTMATLLQLGHPPEGMEAPDWLGAVPGERPRFNWATPRRGWKRWHSGYVLGGDTRFNWATPGGDGSVVADISRASIAQLQLGPPRRGWKPGWVISFLGTFRTLQLGHPPEGMEAVPWHRQAQDRGEASIGPPPGGDGSPAAALRIERKERPLQLGHPPEGMEARSP